MTTGQTWLHYLIAEVTREQSAQFHCLCHAVKRSTKTRMGKNQNTNS